LSKSPENFSMMRLKPICILALYPLAKAGGNSWAIQLKPLGIQFKPGAI